MRQTPLCQMRRKLWQQCQTFAKHNQKKLPVKTILLSHHHRPPLLRSKSLRLIPPLKNSENYVRFLIKKKKMCHITLNMCEWVNLLGNILTGIGALLPFGAVFCIVFEQKDWVPYQTASGVTLAAIGALISIISQGKKICTARKRKRNHEV